MYLQIYLLVNTPNRGDYHIKKKKKEFSKFINFFRPNNQEKNRQKTGFKSKETDSLKMTIWTIFLSSKYILLKVFILSLYLMQDL